MCLNDRHTETTIRSMEDRCPGAPEKPFHPNSGRTRRILMVRGSGSEPVKMDDFPLRKDSIGTTDLPATSVFSRIFDNVFLQLHVVPKPYAEYLAWEGPAE